MTEGVPQDEVNRLDHVRTADSEPDGDSIMRVCTAEGGQRLDSTIISSEVTPQRSVLGVFIISEFIFVLQFTQAGPRAWCSGANASSKKTRVNTFL